MILGENTNIKTNQFIDENKIKKSPEVVLLGITIHES